jgi:radical SAM protein with 4Fe4S-binding SPASM domain
MLRRMRLCGPSRATWAIRETSLSDILKSDIVMEWNEKYAPDCRLCVWRTTCRGGCPAAENDDIYGECPPMRLGEKIDNEGSTK